MCARNRCERFEGTDIFEKLFDDTIKRAVREGALALINRARKRFRLKPTSLGGDKGYFESGFLGKLVEGGIKPHIATFERSRQAIASVDVLRDSLAGDGKEFPFCVELRELRSFAILEATRTQRVNCAFRG